MLKKVKMPLLAVIIALQLIIAGSMITYGLTIDSLIDKKGTEYKIMVGIDYSYTDKITYTPYDESYSLHYFIESDYVEIITDEDGISTLRQVEDGEKRPKEYINSSDHSKFPNICNYDLKEEITLDRFEIQEINLEKCYVTVNVYKGKTHITGLYVNDIPIEEYIKEFQQDQFADEFVEEAE